MPQLLNEKQLLDLLINAIDQSGWQAIAVNARKPFRIRAYREDSQGIDLCVYIWNCTHGGGAARAKDEFRVQLTSTVPSAQPGATTLLLGWHSGYGVFVGFDLTKHSGQASQSPSIQVKEETLRGAHVHAFAIHMRQNGEYAVAFRPEFLIDYALSAVSLHATGKAAADMSLLNGLDSLTQTVIDKVTDEKRRLVLSQIVKKYRATDFRKRVLSAYDHRCAACGVQLELLDAAHIIPVAADMSTDETKNGIALCKLHHAAYDRNLISFDENYTIQVSVAQQSRLKTLNLAGGLAEFEKFLKPVISLPTDRRDYPPAAYIREARRIRKWVG